MEQVNVITKPIIIEFLTDVFSKITGKCEAYLIGGAALTYWGKQNGTKDLDLIVPNIESLENLLEVLLKEGFQVFLEPNSNFKKNVDKPISVIRDDLLIDVFHVRTTHFTLTKSMANRAHNILRKDHSKISIASQEDLFLLKSATGRKSDSEVLRKLISPNFNWDILMHESYNQLQNGNFRASFDIIAALYEADLIREEILNNELYEDLKSSIHNQINNLK